MISASAVSGLALELCSPHPGEQLFHGDHPSCLKGEGVEKIELPRRQIQGRAPKGYGMSLSVDPQVSRHQGGPLARATVRALLIASFPLAFPAPCHGEW